MKTMRSFLAVLALLSTWTTTQGQANLKPKAEQTEALAKLAWMPGNWSGDGWMQIGKEKRYFTQSEQVSLKANGSLIVIDGLGIDKATGDTVHQAYANIYYNMQTMSYMMWAFKGDGNFVAPSAVVNEAGDYVWEFTHPYAGVTRYTTSFSNGQWTEKGEMNRNNTGWIPFFEMTLSKQ